MNFVRSVRRAPQFLARNMSGAKSEAEFVAEGEKWKKISFGMIGLTSLYGAYVYATYHHEHGNYWMPYVAMRNKPFPWSCSNCDLFDGDCWKRARAAGECRED